jgi:sugar-specific transcriptional regulator TrmB
MDEQLFKILTDTGLSGHEARVYLAALSLGPTTILQISRESGVKRTTIYSTIESLKQKGLISIEPRGFKQVYVAEDPAKLELVFESRRQTLYDKLPELSALYNLQGGESVVKYYEGLESVKNIYESMLRDIRPREDYMVITDNERWYNLDPKYFEKFLQKRARVNINIRVLLQNSEAARKHKQMEQVYNEKVKLLPPKVKLTTNLVLIPRRLMFHQLIPPITAIVIENKSAIKMQQEMFEILWDSIPDGQNHP